MFIEACYKFLEHFRVVKNASDHSVRGYATDLNSFKSYMESQLYPDTKKEELPGKIDYQQPYLRDEREGLLKLDQIDRRMVRGFLAWMNSDDKSKRTSARRLSTLRSFFKYSILQKWITINPTEDLEHPKLEKKLPTSLSYDQVEHLFNQPDTETWLGFRDRTIMELFYSSGLRVSELVSLNIEDFDQGSLTVKLKGKGKKERIVPITKNAADWIHKYLAHPERQMFGNNSAIFLNKNGTRLTTRSVDRKFDLYLRSSGLAGKVTPPHHPPYHRHTLVGKRHGPQNHSSPPRS